MTATAPARREDEARSTHLRLPAPLHEDLRAVATRNERSIAAEVRVAVTRHVRRELDREPAAA